MISQPYGPSANEAHTQYERASTHRGSSRGQYAYAGQRQPLDFHQRLAPVPDHIIEGYHGAQTQVTWLDDDWLSHSMRSNRNRGMTAIPRWPNTLPWAHKNVAYAKESAGAHTRAQPRRTSYLEDPSGSGVAETTWMAKTQPPTSSIVNRRDDGLGLGAVTRTSNPFMLVDGRVNSTALSRARKRQPYTLDSRTYSEFRGGRDTGINGIEALLLLNHPLLPNTDEKQSEYDEAQQVVNSAEGKLMRDETKNAVQDILALNQEILAKA